MRFWKPRKIVGTPKVGIAVAAYLNDDCGKGGRLHAALRCLVESLKAQTHRPYNIVITHDGPYEHGPPPVCEACIDFVETKERKQQFGHPHRQAAVERLLQVGCEWVGLTNQDNYYVPVYLEWMLAAAQEKKADLVYCDCVHSHKQWKPMTGELRRGHIDLGGFLVHKSLAQKIKFDKTTFAADWDYVSRLRGAAKRAWHVPGTIFVHN